MLDRPGRSLPGPPPASGAALHARRSEEHTCELQSQSNLVCRLLLEKKKTLRGFFRFEKPFDSGFLAVNALGDPKNPITDVSTGLAEERCREFVRVALGSDEVPITIENIMPWKAQADVADRFQHGRIFIAGDAAHVMPPNGGFGGNTGIQDAHNLASKLAVGLQGQAAPEI